MNIFAKLLNKILATQIQKYKRIIQHVQVGLVSEMQGRLYIQILITISH